MVSSVAVLVNLSVSVVDFVDTVVFVLVVVNVLGTFVVVVLVIVVTVPSNVLVVSETMVYTIDRQLMSLGSNMFIDHCYIQ